MIEPWWTQINGRGLAQGDLLPDCLLPVFAGHSSDGNETVNEILTSATLIVMTQSCDLENNKVSLVALCPIHRLSEFAEINPKYSRPKEWEPVRRGRVEAIHMLASPEQPEINQESLVVDFRQIVSLPTEYLSDHAESLENRWRLISPFLEHFSQAFARFFMRVGLPSTISPFK